MEHNLTFFRLHIFGLHKIGNLTMSIMVSFLDYIVLYNLKQLFFRIVQPDLNIIIFQEHFIPFSKTLNWNEDKNSMLVYSHFRVKFWKVEWCLHFTVCCNSMCCSVLCENPAYINCYCSLGIDVPLWLSTYWLVIFSTIKVISYSIHHMLLIYWSSVQSFPISGIITQREGLFVQWRTEETLRNITNNLKEGLHCGHLVWRKILTNEKNAVCPQHFVSTKIIP